eukprot:gene8669-33796_t
MAATPIATPRNFAGSVTVQLVHYATAKIDLIATIPVQLAPGAGTTSFFCPDGAHGNGGGLATQDHADAVRCSTFQALLAKAGCAVDGSDCILRVKVAQSLESSRANAGGQFLLGDNLLPLSKPSAFKLPAAAVTATVASVDEENGTASITLISESEGAALYVWLSTLAHGRFEDNRFMLLPGTTTLDFIAFGMVEQSTSPTSSNLDGSCFAL